jgi:small subunit ribosomal protein S1
VENVSSPAEAPAPPAPVIPPSVQECSVVPAKVVKLTSTAAVVDFGWKSQGEVPFADFVPKGEAPRVKEGDTFEVFVESLGDAPGEVVLSRDKAAKLHTWDDVLATCAKGGPIQGTVLSRVPGGYSVSVGLPAFLPNSQSGARRQDKTESLVGQTLMFDVAEVEPKKAKIVLTRKALAEKELEARRQETLARLAEGATVTGVVKTIADYGAFLDLGGVDGLLHVSQMSWSPVGHPRDVVKVGQQLTVQVLKHDAASGKIGLGLKQLQQDPWAGMETRFPVGATVEGTVAGLTEFGAFVALAPGVEGLIHISEMSWTKKVKHPSEELKVGEAVKAVVLALVPEAHRLSLGLRQLQPNPWTVLSEKLPEGTKVHGKVRSITDFGLFIELEAGIDGLVHISELTWTGKVAHPGELHKVGDEVDAVVLKVDQEDKRISLSIKQLQPSPWQSFKDAHPVGSRLKGRVKKVVDFGAFVEVEPGIEGLVHVSELSEEHVDRVADAVKIGQELEVQVTEIDLGKRKLGLSVKALTQLSRAEYQEHLAPVEVKTTLGELFKDQLTKK